jgi:thymidylate synthase (FAD)
VPREDARFVLPYSFLSNFYVTLNARELIAIVSEMRYGRGAAQPEITNLGAQLEAQFDSLYPGVIAAEKARHSRCAARHLPTAFRRGGEAKGGAELVAATPDPQEALSRAIAFGGRFAPDDGDYASERNMMALVKDARPRELEFLTAQFCVKNVSLACVTHFTRHRMLSLLVPDAAHALANGNYVVPENVRKDAALHARYEAAFAGQADLAEELTALGVPAHDMAYLALSGHMTDLLLEMNARELLHFMKLRTCNRANGKFGAWRGRCSTRFRNMTRTSSGCSAPAAMWMGSVPRAD